MKEWIKKIVKCCCIVCCLTVMFVCICSCLDEKPTFADSGFSTSHSSSHSSSSHSSSSSSRSSSRSSSSSSSSRSRSSSSSSSGGSMSAGSAIFSLVIFGIVVLVIIISSRKSSNNNNSTVTVSPDKSKDVEEKIKKILPTFDKDQFIAEGFKIYTDIQTAWMNFKLDDVKGVITDEMYNMYQSQLDTLEVKGEQNIMKDMILRSAKLMDVSSQNDVITIKVLYTVDQYDYIADANTGKLIRGEDKKKMRVDYVMCFRKTLNSKANIDTCPNCGAELKDFNGSGVCKYCGAKLVSDNSSWVLTEKQAINQRYI